MGSAKKAMMEQEQERYDIELAGKLGITVDELYQCNYSFDDDTSNDGLVYRTYIQFDTDNSPKQILKKIGVDSMGRVELENNTGE